MSIISRRQLLAASGVALSAQTASAWQEPATFSTAVNVVNVLVTVKDRDGNLITHLTRGDFELAEDGRTQEIQYFSAESDLPLTLGLLFDMSGSQRGVIEEQRIAAQSFLDEMLRAGDGVETSDQAFVVGFNRAVELVEMPTASREMLDVALSRLEVPRDAAGNLLPRAEGTAVFQAIAGAASVFRDQAGRKAIVVLSDGVDTASSVDVNGTIEAALRADAIVYAIRVFDQDVFRYNIRGPALDNLRRGQKDLEKLAEKTGGAVFDIAGETTLAEGFRALNRELRSQYSLGYSPEATRDRNRYREIRVRLAREVADRRNLAVHARDGYYAAQ